MIYIIVGIYYLLSRILTIIGAAYLGGEFDLETLPVLFLPLIGEIVFGFIIWEFFKEFFFLKARKAIRNYYQKITRYFFLLGVQHRRARNPERIDHPRY